MQISIVQLQVVIVTNKKYYKIMKKYTLIIGITIFSLSVGLYGYYLQSNIKSPLVSVDVEALTQGESGGIDFRCRCHNDNACYGGNAISFRRLCYKENSHDNGAVAQCHSYNMECL